MDWRILYSSDFGNSLIRVSLFELLTVAMAVNRHLLVASTLVAKGLSVAIGINLVGSRGQLSFAT